MKSGRLNVREKIVCAAVLADQVRGGAFTPEDLVVAAWRLFPEDFGMVGYDLPHSLRVNCRLSGPDGLVERGLIERVAGDLRVTKRARRGVELQGGVACLVPSGGRVVEAVRALGGFTRPLAPANPAPLPSAPLPAPPASPPPAAPPRRRPKPSEEPSGARATSRPREAPVAPPVAPPAAESSWVSVPMPQRFVGSPIPRGMPVRPLPPHPVVARPSCP